MITVPSDKKELLRLTNELVEQCNISLAARAADCRLLALIAETGRCNGDKALVNTLNKHLDRTAAHLFSPIELKFTIDFEFAYPKRINEQAAVAAKSVTRQWDRNDTDILFGRGVFESLKYGASFLKQWVQEEGESMRPRYYAGLVMPWQFGVYNETQTDLNLQPVLCETLTMTLPEVWRRIWHLPDAKKLYDRIVAHSQTGTTLFEPRSYFHSILSSSTLNTGESPITQPGGVLQIGNSGNFSVMGPQVGAPTVVARELWVQDDEDYTTIFLIEPDIIVSPSYKNANLLIKGSGLQPYRKIQPNEVTNWIWGRSELIDLVEPQGLLATTCDDLKRLIGIQIDKILGFIGEGGPTDETYGQMRNAGYFNLGQGASITDLTPKIPPELLPFLKFLLDTIDKLSGFPPIMTGQGEPGVRAGVHANTLMKTASPTLRDRALITERNCSVAADLTLSIREAKDSGQYWVKGDTPKDIEETSFLLADLPEDWRVTVDSHSSSPIFADENTQLVMASHKMGIVDGDYVIDNVALPNKEAAKISLRERKKAQEQKMQQLMQQFPEAGEKLAVRQLSGSKR